MSKQLTFLKALSFFHIGGKAIILPFLPLFLHLQGFSSVEIGTIMGVAPIVSIIAQPLVGFVSDKFKTIKKILILLYFAVIAASFGLFFTAEFWVVFLSFVLFHFALSPCSPLIDSMTLKSLGPERRHEYGKIRLWGSLGFALIAGLSGPVLVWIGLDKIYILFWFFSLLMIFLLFFLKDTGQSSAPVNLKGVGEVIRNKQFVTFLLLCFLIMIPHRTNDTMLVLHLENLGATALLIGLAWGLAAISEVPVFYYLTKKIMELNHLFILGVIAALYTVRWLLYGVIDSAVMITILQVSQGVTFGLFWIVALQTAAKFVPNHLRSTGQALLASICFGLGGAIGGTVGGWVFDVFGSFVMYQLMGLTALGATICIFIFYRVSAKKLNQPSVSREA
ncbi:PPP family 3-phenylpropionic acid transporter [Evansella vedderi]|uniref:PPP family 3-phenylpropionic acid transporter n=1 Tax=Evansella vedderi TaxID=38282 RepID=A0ABT9ZRL1_9BACI|nr:MFS transporter [Evansella vedderi]MDQ0253103.1 PPP family 3-phenylpropionic acid transporter [Evansella vedderi]